MALVAMVLGLAMAERPMMHEPLVQDPARAVAGLGAEVRDGSGKPGDAKLPGTAEGIRPASEAVDGRYRIGPEDVLKIEVWKEQDFTSSAQVRADGKISIPLLNDVQAAGLTPEELAASLRKQLLRFVVDPKITVSVTQMNSRKAYVMGQVTRQGIVRLQSNMTVLQAISAAGGLGPFANAKKIYVLRSQADGKVRLPFNYNAVIKGKHPEQNVLLEPGDTVVVP